MRAAEHDRVGRFRAFEQRAEIALCRGDSHAGLRPALFGERHEHLAGPLHHAHVAFKRADGARVGLALHRPFGGDHGDAAVAGGGDAARAPGSITPITGTGASASARRPERHGRGRVAGDHHHLHTFGDEVTRRLERIGLHRLGALGAVGEAGGIAEIDEGLIRQARGKGAQHREPAHAGVEHSDRAWIRQARRSRIPRNRGRGSAGRPR